MYRPVREYFTYREASSERKVPARRKDLSENWGKLGTLWPTCLCHAKRKVKWVPETQRKQRHKSFFALVLDLEILL